MHTYSTAGRLQDSGATAVEYALVAGFIAAVVVGTVAILGQEVVGLFLTVFPAF